MKNHYPSGNPGMQPTDPLLQKRSLDWLLTERNPDIISDSFVEDWNSGPQGKTRVIDDVQGLMMDSVFKAKDSLGPSQAESVIDLALRNAQVLTQEASSESYKSISHADYLGQILASAGMLFRGKVVEAYPSNVSFATPRNVGKEQTLRILVHVQDSANKHEGKIELDENSALALVQLVNAQLGMIKFMMAQNELGTDRAFAQLDKYVLTNLFGMVTQAKEIAMKSGYKPQITPDSIAGGQPDRKESWGPPELPIQVPTAVESEQPLTHEQRIADAIARYPNGVLVRRSSGEIQRLEILNRTTRPSDNGALHIAENRAVVAIPDEVATRLIELDGLDESQDALAKEYTAQAVEAARRLVSEAEDDIEPQATGAPELVSGPVPTEWDIQNAVETNSQLVGLGRIASELLSMPQFDAQNPDSRAIVTKLVDRLCDEVAVANDAVRLGIDSKLARRHPSADVVRHIVSSVSSYVASREKWMEGRGDAQGSLARTLEVAFREVFKAAQLSDDAKREILARFKRA